MSIINNTYTNYLNGTYEGDVIYNYVPAYVHGLYGDDQILNAAQIAFMYGDNGNDAIFNCVNDSQVCFDGGVGCDTLINQGSGVSTLYGGFGFGDLSNDSDVLVGNPNAKDVFLIGEYCGNDLIMNYDSNDTIYCATTSGQLPTTCISGNDVLVVGMGINVTVQNAAYKQLNFEYLNSYGTGKSLAETYKQIQPALMDISAADNIWGNDNFYCTSGVDNVFISQTQKNKVVFNAGQEDMIHLYDTSLSDIVSANSSSGIISLLFRTGNVSMVQCIENISPKFILASGEGFVYNQVLSTWIRSN